MNKFLWSVLYLNTREYRYIEAMTEEEKVVEKIPALVSCTPEIQSTRCTIVISSK